MHHLNGVRDDNRLGNLELWTRPQPIRIRVGDAVAWAREILARYEPDGRRSGTSNSALTMAWHGQSMAKPLLESDTEIVVTAPDATEAAAGAPVLDTTVSAVFDLQHSGTADRGGARRHECVHLWRSTEPTRAGLLGGGQ